MAKRSPSGSGSGVRKELVLLRALVIYKLKCETKMLAFDRLPKTVRAALTASQFNWNVEQLHQAWRKKRMTARQMVKHIQSEDRIRLQERRP